MAYTLRIPESSVYGKKKFVNKKGNTECVEFIQQATGAPATLAWRKGIKVKDASPTGYLADSNCYVRRKWKPALTGLPRGDMAVIYLLTR